jgi:hypothetical protein
MRITFANFKWSERGNHSHLFLVLSLVAPCVLLVRINFFFFLFLVSRCLMSATFSLLLLLMTADTGMSGMGGWKLRER